MRADIQGRSQAEVARIGPVPIGLNLGNSDVCAKGERAERRKGPLVLVGNALVKRASRDARAPSDGLQRDRRLVRFPSSSGKQQLHAANGLSWQPSGTVLNDKLILVSTLRRSSGGELAAACQHTQTTASGRNRDQALEISRSKRESSAAKDTAPSFERGHQQSSAWHSSKLRPDNVIAKKIKLRTRPLVSPHKVSVVSRHSRWQPKQRVRQLKCWVPAAAAVVHPAGRCFALTSGAYNAMSISAAKAKGADSSAKLAFAGCLERRHLARGRKRDRKVGKVELGVQLLTVKVARYRCGSNSQDGLDQAGHSCGTLKVPNVALVGSKYKRAFGSSSGAVDCLQRADLNGVSKRCARSVRLDVADLGRLKLRTAKRCANHSLLRRTIGCSQAGAPPVLVCGCTAQLAVHAIHVHFQAALGAIQGHQHNGSTAFAPHVAIGVRRKRFAASLWRQHACATGRLKRL